MDDKNFRSAAKRIKTEGMGYTVVTFFKHKKKSVADNAVAVQVQTYDHEGRGLAVVNHQPCLISGALPGEQVVVRLTQQKKRYALAKLQTVQTAHPERVKPACIHYQQCGGCDLQHMSMPLQQQFKQHSWQQALLKHGDIEVQQVDTWLIDEPWFYRRRARLAVSFDQQRQSCHVGFRAKASKKIVPIEACMVLTPALQQMLQPLRLLLTNLSRHAQKHIGHIECLDVEGGVWLLFRCIKPLSEADQILIQHECHAQQWHGGLWDGADGLCLLEGSALPQYTVAIPGQQSVQLQFRPYDFIQVNARQNQAMIEQAMQWLKVQAHETVLDLFCGVGNFSLPFALVAKQVWGVEGQVSMVAQAQYNADLNRLGNLQFFQADLSQPPATAPWIQPIDSLILDPSRQGAKQALSLLCRLTPKKILYVSCHPMTLANDVALIQQQGYELQRSSLIEMFPQTHHIESMLLFELKVRT
jgi:23S rRNA (uracil1939-C5)-methyltransferase